MFKLLFFALLLVTSNCNSTDIQNQDNQTNKSTESIIGAWQVSSLTGIERLEKQPTLTIDANSISGNSGCNSYGGAIKFSEKSISINNIVKTEMYCNKIQHIENAFIEAIENADSYQLKNNELLLFSKEKKLLTLNKKALANTEKINNTKWTTNYVSGLKTLSQKPWLAFSDNEIYGNAACNSYRGSFKVNDNNTIAFSKIAATLMYCDDTMEIESSFIKNLKNTASYKITENELQLFSENNELLLSFVPQNNKVQSIEYKAITRGSSITLKVTENSVFYEDHEAKRDVKISVEEKNTIQKLVNELDIENLHMYEAPSEQRQTDAALHATITITKGNQQYTSQTFDHGNNPEELDALVRSLFKLVGKE